MNNTAQLCFWSACNMFRVDVTIAALMFMLEGFVRIENDDQPFAIEWHRLPDGTSYQKFDHHDDYPLLVFFDVAGNKLSTVIH
jgi:hypothetical protein